jgi:pilus assembly protein Flp/PilA
LPSRVYAPLERLAYVARADNASQKAEVELKRTFSNFLADESGATAIEYGLIAAGIALAIITIVNSLGGTLNTKFTTLNTALN